MAAEMIRDGISQDAVKQHGEFFRRFISVAFCKFEHAVLYDVQCHMLVTHRKQRMFVGSALGTGKKFGKLFAGGQGGLLKARHDNKFL